MPSVQCGGGRVRCFSTSVVITRATSILQPFEAVELADIQGARRYHFMGCHMTRAALQTCESKRTAASFNIVMWASALARPGSAGTMPPRCCWGSPDLSPQEGDSLWHQCVRLNPVGSGRTGGAGAANKEHPTLLPGL